MVPDRKRMDYCHMAAMIPQREICQAGKALWLNSAGNVMSGAPGPPARILW
jgi:hypothetical protein